ncbi:hypothetical protein HV418_10375 [Enterococcus faecium]|nr:hypothetical protein [Enterococcus faecium]
MRYGRLVALLVILSSISLFIGVSNVQLSELLQLDGQSLNLASDSFAANDLFDPCGSDQ